MGLPVLRRISLYTCRRHYPGGTVGCALRSASPTTAAFPEIQTGRLPHRPFRGLLSVHSRYGLHTRRVAVRPSTPEALRISLPTSPLRLLPTGATLVGWDFHPLKIRAFHGARRVEMWRGGLGTAYPFPPLSSGGASIALPCSVSTSRSSNRTCGFPASGSPTAVAFGHTLPALTRRLHPKAKLVPGSPVFSWRSQACATLQTLRPFPSVAEVRPLSSTGITRLHRYYGPVRHPIRPGLALAGCRLVNCHHRWGFPCCVGSPCIHAVAITPAGPLGARFALLPQRRRPSPRFRRVGSRIALFEACSAFTHVTACILAESPCDPLHQRL